jgi:RND family efflux transporter MFP subunit
METPTETPVIDNTAATRSLKRAGIGFAVVALLIVVWSLFSGRLAARRLAEDTEARAVVTVATTKPQPVAGDAVLTLPGSVEARTDAPIYARTSGYLKRWLVDIGASVKAGQVLAEIEAPELDQQLRGAEADVATAAASEKIASTTAERWRGLRDSDSVSRQQADEKLSEADAAQARLHAAEAELQRLRELTGFKKIVAPFDGVVTARNTDVGDLISAGGGGTALFRIADTRQLRLYVRVPQAYAAQLQAGLAAEVRFPDRPGRSFNAKLERTSNSLDATSRTLLAQLIVDNANGELLPGGYAEVDFKLPPAAGNAALKLPANVLLANAQGLQVATVDGQGKVALKPVALGRDFGADIEIVTGLAADDDVILSPPDSLTADTKIRVAQPAAAPQP